jgi:hypothetical protein
VAVSPAGAISVCRTMRLLVAKLLKTDGQGRAALGIPARPRVTHGNR